MSSRLAPSKRQRALVPAILLVVVGAAGVLAYFAGRAALRFAQLGDETIAQTTLLLVDEKVDQVEQELIAADNRVFSILRQKRAEEIRRARELKDTAPTLRAAFALDDRGQIEGLFFRGSAARKRRFLKLFYSQMVVDMELAGLRPGVLRHLHRSYGSRSYLLAYKTTRRDQRLRTLVIFHDTDWVVREHFIELFGKGQDSQLFNVVDNQGQRVMGRDLAGTGDYLVGRRFPSTLYEWRLQVAPVQAPELEAQSQKRQINEVALIVAAFLVILAAIAFLAYVARQERQVNQLKSEFIANVSHELKTPLSVVRMFADLLREERVSDPEKQRRYLEIICRESDLLTGLIDNVLDFSALERGKQRFAYKPVVMNEVLKRAVDTIRHRIESDDMVVELACPDEPVEVEADEHAILLAVVNLLDNAVKYGDSPITVALEASSTEASISVRDNGPGISEAHLKRIFERFFRSDTKKTSRGSGIGLALVKEIARAHGGTASARNLPEGGGEVGFTVKRSYPSRS